MVKITNVILNSNQALANSTNNNATFNFDWGSVLKSDKPYLLTWSYMGQPNTLTVASKVAQIQIDFQMEQYLNKVSTYGAPTATCIGVLRSIFLNNALNFLYAETGSNPAIYMQTRPFNNLFTVKVLTNDATPIGWTDNAGVPVVNNNYMLTLSFEEVDN
jgi:hypothetical protein